MSDENEQQSAIDLANSILTNAGLPSFSDVQIENERLLELIRLRGSIPSTPHGGAATPDSRERPALIGDQVDADIEYLRMLGTPAFPSEVIGKSHAQRISEIATRYEVIAGAYFASWKRENHIAERESRDERRT